MKKTIHVNIAGTAFTMDEDAYERLKNYLQAIESYFVSSTSKKEIMDDIEARISELLKGKITDFKQVISLEDIETVQQVMGQPQDYSLDQPIEEPKQNSGYTNQEDASKKGFLNRKIYRDTDERVLGGVSSGLAHFFDVDKVWIRLIFVFIVFLGGSGILIYIILWIVIPKADTTAEKLEMKGQKVDFNNIGKAVEEEFNSVKQKMNEYSYQFAQKSKNPMDRLASFLKSVFGVFGRAIMVFIGMVFIGIALGFLAMVIGLLTSDTMFMNINNDGSHFFPLKILDFIFSNPTDKWMFKWGIAFIFFSVILSLLWGGIKLLFRIRMGMRYLGVFLTILFFSGLFLTIYSGVQISKEYRQNGSSEAKQIIPTASDTLFVSSTMLQQNMETDEDLELFSNEYVQMQENAVELGFTRLDIKETDEDSAYVVVDRMSKGRSVKEAIRLAEKINYQYQITGNKIILNPSYNTNEKLWRAQQVKVRLHLPQNQVVYIDESVKDLLNDVKNTSHDFNEDLIGNYWIMTKDGLKKL